MPANIAATRPNANATPAELPRLPVSAPLLNAVGAGPLAVEYCPADGLLLESYRLATGVVEPEDSTDVLDGLDPSSLEVPVSAVVAADSKWVPVGIVVTAVVAADPSSPAEVTTAAALSPVTMVEVK